MAADFFVVATITYRLLFVLVILAHDRWRVVHVAVTNAYAERVIGSSRRECLDHVVVMTEAGLRGIVAQYLAYYHHAPTHLALNKDAPVPRRVTAHGIVAIRSSAGSIIDTDRRAA